MIAKACTAQNDELGDGTTSTVLMIGELLKQAENYVGEVRFFSNFFSNFKNFLNFICLFLKCKFFLGCSSTHYHRRLCNRLRKELGIFAKF